jgi:hypothetical protein
LGNQVSKSIFPRNRVAQLYPRALGSLLVASYDSQGYGGSILTSLHTDILITAIKIKIIDLITAEV